jgi:3-hydroxy acid dehydrogenase / malonic semialdehyde reductase
MSKTIFITGATSGFGRAMAILFAKNGYNVIINGRREERLVELESKIKSEHDVDVLKLPFDVRKREEVLLAISSLLDEWKKIDVLVNNAGLALGLSEIQNGNLDDWDTMIDTNVKGLLYVTKGVAPLMIERQSGHIINIGSVAGKEVYPRGNVYCATKHSVDALNKAMRIDLLPHNIKVTSINPGLAETEFSVVRFHGDTERAGQTYQGFIPLNADDIAEAAWFVVSRPAHVNINEMIITPTVQANSRDLVKNI